MWLLLPSLAAAAMLGACSADIGEAPGPEVTFPAPPFDAAPAQLRRLTSSQYANTIHDILGDHIVVPSNLEPDERVAGLLAIGVARRSTSARGVEQYSEAAYAIAEQALAPGPERDALVPCAPTGIADLDCAERFVRRTGRRLWRAPLQSAEVDTFAALAITGARHRGDFYEGLSFALAAMLQSPSFLYRNEIGDPVPGQWRAFNDWRIAERLSYFIWNSAPDDELLDAAANGQLGPNTDISAQVERMLEDPKARRGVRAFFNEMLRLYLLDNGLSRDPEQFPHYTPEVGPSAKEETLRLIEWLVFEEQGDYRTLLTTPTTFLNRKLAAIYRVPAPAREGFGRYDYPADSPRRGLLGHLSILAPHSHEGSSSATLRGVFLREAFLCGEIPDPPADVDTSIPEPSPEARTLRQRVAVHLEDPFCATCHMLMDPLGLALEHFDALGQYRPEYTFVDGTPVPIDATGYLDDTDFDDHLGLAEAISENPRFTWCLTRTMFRYATGHVDLPSERGALNELLEAFEGDGHRVKTLIRAIAQHRAFRLANPPESDTETAMEEEQ